MGNKHRNTAVMVSHTHWDRAWYLSFEQFRYRLVRMIDRLIDLLETNTDFHSFTLDGQTILLDDYLAIRPEKREQLHQLIRNGKLLVGPWYVLPDLFLVSGESVIRNLQLGLKTAKRFGSSMQEGYVPDPFGHFAQMPQILNQFGIHSFIFMRGLSEADKKRTGSIFTWQSPDGSDVLTVYLLDGYYNSASLGFDVAFGRHDGQKPDPVLAAKQITATVAKLSDYQKESIFLLNNGFDHMPEMPGLPALLEEIKPHLNGLSVYHGTFAEFIRGVKEQHIPHEVLSGDLLGNADHPILSSVFSTRVYLKQQNHRAQSLLERYTEPFTWFTYTFTAAPDVTPFHNHAWNLLLQNHPHDDICGCSIDGVHQDNEARFRQIEDLAQTMMIEGMEQLLHAGTDMPDFPDSEPVTHVFLFNPHPWEQNISVDLPVLFANKDAEAGVKLPEQPLEAADAYGNPVSLQVIATKEHALRNNFLESTWGRRYDIHLETVVPALGYKMVRVQPSSKTTLKPLNRLVWSLSYENSVLSITHTPTGVQFTDPFCFEYERDNGDTYSFGPMENNRKWTGTCVAATPHAVLPNTWLLEYRIAIPAKLDSEETLTMPISVYLTEHPQGYLTLRISYENEAENGRFRILFPAPAHTGSATADAHFRLAERVTPETRTPESDPDRYNSYPGELNYTTSHMNDFLWVEAPDASKIWVAARGNHEFELARHRNSTAIALTLHRAVGLLSTGNGRIRRVQAGPSIPVPGAQCRLALTFDLAFGMHTGDSGSLMRMARGFAHPVWAREMPWLPHLRKKGAITSTLSILEIDNPWIQLSSLRRNPDTGDTTLRICNYSASAQKGSLKLALKTGQWCITDLNESWNPSTKKSLVDGRIDIEVKAHRIMTILIR